VSALEIYIKPGDKYGSGRSRLAVFSLDGKPRWASPPADRSYATALVPNDNLILSLNETAPYKLVINALDLANGAMLWTAPASFSYGASDGTLFYADEGSRQTSALRISTGGRVWQQPVDSRHVLYAQGRVFAVGDHTVATLEAATGKVLWQTKFGAFPVDQVVAAHDHLYLEPEGGATPRGYRPGIMAVDAASGKEIWSALTGTDWIAGPIAATADSLVAIGQDWKDNTFEYELLILDPASGAEKSRVALGNELVEGIAVAGEQVYVLSDTLRVYGPTQPGK
jgi:outer membrane protein assembly factor BamB